MRRGSDQPRKVIRMIDRLRLTRTGRRVALTIATSISVAVAQVGWADRATDPAATAPASSRVVLESWNDGAARRAIVGFVGRVTREGSPDFVSVPERVAVFDNDGTLWSEKPVPFQVMFAFDRVKAMAPQHPEWSSKEPFA